MNNKTFGWLLTIILALTAASCTLFDNTRSPQGYVRHCVRLLDRDGLYADQPEWQAKKKEVLSTARSLSAWDEIHSLVQEAASVAGGQHSFLMPPVKDTASFSEFVPDVTHLLSFLISVAIIGLWKSILI